MDNHQIPIEQGRHNENAQRRVNMPQPVIPCYPPQQQNQYQNRMVYPQAYQGQVNQTRPQVPARAVRDYMQPIVEPFLNVRGRVNVPTHHFELKQALINMVQNNQFHGEAHKYPHTHLQTFLDYCDTIQLHEVPSEVIKLKLFLFSLHGTARQWYQNLQANQRASWEELVRRFLDKFFPESKVNEYRNKISGFRMEKDENLHETFERFQELIRKCPQHGFA